MRLLIILTCLLTPAVAFGHAGALDEYGCHSNKALYGKTTTRECHIDLLAGQVFASTTAEYKAYIAAQKVVINGLQTDLTQTKADLAACKLQCPEPPPVSKDLTISWAANTEPDLAGYRVSCGTQSSKYTMLVDVKMARTYTFTNLPSGTYYCAATAYDTANNESTYSVEVSKVIP